MCERSATDVLPIPWASGRVPADIELVLRVGMIDLDQDGATMRVGQIAFDGSSWDLRNGDTMEYAASCKIQ